MIPPTTQNLGLTAIFMAVILIVLLTAMAMLTWIGPNRVCTSVPW